MLSLSRQTLLETQEVNGFKLAVWRFVGRGTFMIASRGLRIPITGIESVYQFVQLRLTGLVACRKRQRSNTSKSGRQVPGGLVFVGLGSKASVRAQFPTWTSQKRLSWPDSKQPHLQMNITIPPAQQKPRSRVLKRLHVRVRGFRITLGLGVVLVPMTRA